jgi:hypothetical protein
MAAPSEAKSAEWRPASPSLPPLPGFTESVLTTEDFPSSASPANNWDSVRRRAGQLEMIHRHASPKDNAKFETSLSRAIDALMANHGTEVEIECEGLTCGVIRTIAHQLGYWCEWRPGARLCLSLEGALDRVASNNSWESLPHAVMDLYPDLIEADTVARRVSRPETWCAGFGSQ